MAPKLLLKVSGMTSVYANSTSAANSMTSLLACKSFSCSAPDCYTMYMNETASNCSSGNAFCELKRLSSSNYTTGCSTTCNSTSSRCANETQLPCVVECCRTPNCLNGSMQLIRTSFVTTRAPTTTTTNPTTTVANNGKKCQTMTCNGEACYKTQAKNDKLCPIGYEFCELKKTVANAVMTWTSGCSKDCIKLPLIVCTSTTVDCLQECCNATQKESCLKMDGSVNMPNGASTLYIPSHFIFLTSSFLIWILNSQLQSLLIQ
nr:PREDICTED: uncharacterized protein LOC107077505 isoform X2 [Lepisosteus oculatus]